MDKEWSELSPEEKRKERFRKWLSPDNINFDSPEAKDGYRERAKRVIDAVSLEKPDRTAVIFHPVFVPARYSGYTVREVMYDSEKLSKAWFKFMDDIELDVLPSAWLVNSGETMEIMGSKTMKWAGCGLPDNVSYQFVENELVRADEWDEYENNRADFNLKTYLPRVYRAAEPFTKLPSLSSIGAFGSPGLGAFANPEIQAGFEAFARAEKVEAEWMKAIDAIDNRGISMGLPNFFRSPMMGGAPLDMIGAGLRGTRGTVMDMYQRPERIIKFMEKAVEETITGIKMMSRHLDIPFSLMPLHRGADGFMSETQFKTFYWPYLKRVVEGYVEEGIIPILFAEGGYNSRLEIIQDLPEGSVIWHFDQTDMIRAKEILGDRVCIMGNIPASLLVTGTPDDVKDHCRKLIKALGKNGGYILAPGAAPDEAKIENLNAILDASKECE